MAESLLDRMRVALPPLLGPYAHPLPSSSFASLLFCLSSRSLPQPPQLSRPSTLSPGRESPADWGLAASYSARNLDLRACREGRLLRARHAGAHTCMHGEGDWGACSELWQQ